MTNRTFLLLGVLLALPAAAPLAASGADTRPMQWSAGGAPPASGSADEAAQLARQAAELAARAAQMAAAAQNSATASATSTLATGAASPATVNGVVQQPNVVEIRFQNSATAPTANTAASGAFANLPAITLPTPAVAPNSVAVPTAQFAQSVVPQATIQDGQVHLAANTYMDGRLLRVGQEESLPAAPGSPQPVPLTSSAYDGACSTDCCCPQRVLYWTGGVEATFLSPDLNSDGVSFEVQRTTDDRDDVFTTATTDVDSLYVSPRAWVGIQGCCWGANLRYWHLQASEGQFDPALGGFGNWDDFDCGRPDVGFFSSNRLEAYTIDLEVTRRFCINDCAMQASLGLRYADVEHNQSITGTALTDEGLLEGYARSDRYSRGTGLQLGLYGRKPVFPCSCVSWFYNLRWSTLWGPTGTSAETFASVQSIDPNFVATAASVNSAQTRVSDTLFIGEVQLGLEWNYALQCIPANTFCRFAVEYQRWDGGKGFSDANSFAGISITQNTDPTSIVRTAGSAEEPQMDLFGFTFGAGITW